MSAHDDTLAHGHGDGHGHGHGHGESEIHISLGGYVTGFALSVILTAIPFWLVMGRVFEQSSTTAMVLLALGAVQIVVHMVYFLHLNARSEGGWNMLALIFTLVLVVITLTGTLWVMFHLNSNMMPGMHTTKTLP
ncbi:MULTISPECIES: cytochrome o ubiquinol oxidase subunit IV [Cupriavidus]|uniref:Cytochrome bo(3) ubiquinol oxidase subunit 4 n=1 Tax=Cupriavidus taiwanensis TaxID=164546 RepID=A0A976AN33_9BURK|nr:MULTISPECIES: cytochrome o ubiquinol oxidase subunit IV [Cupriavidus]MEC3764117.1 cytochrome o ubiquinol oxidase subunit IV [Cupriavidus sp. SS-3]SOY93435.1 TRANSMEMBRANE CYTOCHROME O UBIQUINOL OXIDASE (SUBUNIT IV) OXIDOREDUCTASE PROTEIN [Cupriavidus taiwanensis]SOY96317.1 TRANSMEMBRANE CYTOCHROME O UBIQUINOL OXIDASE (SUBUNIT IV) OXIDOREDUCTASE PROTEIN [Cupriavidus taiwanensis]SPD69006.1 Cytochrome bo(3) ubiquinol oxidase subunit 4 [Cupriavidus taiwanensis]